MQAETKFKNKTRKDLKDLQAMGYPIWFTKIQQVGLRGTPDFLLCVGGMFVAVELKKDSDEKADALQGHNLRKINKAQGIGILASPENWEKVLGTIKILAKGGKYDRTKFQEYQ